MPIIESTLTATRKAVAHIIIDTEHAVHHISHDLHTKALSIDVWDDDNGERIMYEPTIMGPHSVRLTFMASRAARSATVVMIG